MITPAKIGLLIIFLQVGLISFAQVTTAPKADTVKEFEILRGPSMRSINIDSVTTLQTIAGGAIIKQGTTIFSSDSVAINPATHVVEAFGNVHINQADSVQTYAQYLKYIGTEKTAYLKKDVRLNDKKGTVFTQQLDYNLGTGIGNYHNRGKVVNGKTIITSDDGTYYADTKDVYFKNHVEVTEPQNHITTDSLLYNMRTQGSNFTGTTHIKNKDADINTTEGTYDFVTGNALFTSRTSVRDSSGKIYVANHMALDNKSGNAQLEGNAVIKDSANGVIVVANQIFLNKKNNSFLATRKPVLIIKQKSDSIYVAADTIFSGYTTSIAGESFILKKDSVIQDTSQVKLNTDSSKIDDSAKHNLPKAKEDQAGDSAKATSATPDSLKFHRKEIQGQNSLQDSAKINSPKPALPSIDSGKGKAPLKKTDRPDSIKTHNKDTVHILRPVSADSVVSKVVPRQMVPLDTTKINKKDTVHKLMPASADSVRKMLPQKMGRPDSVQNNRKDSVNKISPFLTDSSLVKVSPKETDSSGGLKNVTKDSANQPDSAVRKILAFHHVRIFSDSLQSVCDSLFFSAKDSVFRLYYDPVMWSGHTQIMGDTIFLYTKNRKPERLYVFERGMIINKTTQGFYNQIAGKTINGYFINSSIDYMRVRGSQSESIYYVQDDDSAYVGMNRASGDVIDLYFKKEELKKVLFVNDIKGKLYPMKQIPEDQKFLKNFIWLDSKRPKNKLELFE